MISFNALAARALKGVAAFGLWPDGGRLQLVFEVLAKDDLFDQVLWNIEIMVRSLKPDAGIANGQAI